MQEMKKLTPRKIVKELNKYIIGQDDAKRHVAIAMRNRWRRQNVKTDIQSEIMPNNIILIGPTGVGKTEIARRLSKLANAPFIKVEASKFTEVGYVGSDVESMVRELMDVAINDTRAELVEQVKAKAFENAKHKLLDQMLPPPKKSFTSENTDVDYEEKMASYKRTRAKFLKKLEDGKLDDRDVEISVENAGPPHVEVFSNIGFEAFDLNIGEMISNMMPQKKDKKAKSMKVPQALAYLQQAEETRLVNKEKVMEIAKDKVENHGIIFIDEIDKIASSNKDNKTDVSRSGVQRDLLPIVEGSNVPTKHGIINTSHILFIAAGAFHTAKPSDLIPELQGRFPIRVELNSLTREDFEKILTIPKNALIKQYEAMFKTERVKLSFEEDAISELAAYAADANEKMEDIGARRLHTILSTLLEEYLFEMPETKYKNITINKDIVVEKLSDLVKNEDLSRYIL